MKKLTVILFSCLLVACSSPEIFTNKGNSSYRADQYEDALILFKKAFDLNPEVGTARKIGDTYLKMRDYNQAEYWYKWIRSSSEFSVSDYYILSEILISNSKYSEAKIVLEDLAAYDESQTSVFRWQNLVKITYDSSILLKSAGSEELLSASSLNSSYSDYGYFSFKEKKYFLSDRIDFNSINKRKSRSLNEVFLSTFYKIYEENSDSTSQSTFSFLNDKSIILENNYELGPIFLNDSLFIYTYSSVNSVKLDKDTELLNPQIKIIENNKEIIFPYTGLKNYIVSDPFFSPSQNRIYFTANFPDSYGGMDIYYIERKSANVWSNPSNCGSQINSPGDERSPFYYKDTLYFSSNGKGGLGGFDIFKSFLDFGGFKTPLNLGIPYNSSKDDLFYFIDVFENNLEVLSSDREGGMGSDDIYFITKNEYLNSNQDLLSGIDSLSELPSKDLKVSFDSNLSGQKELSSLLDNRSVSTDSILNSSLNLTLLNDTTLKVTTPDDKLLHRAKNSSLDKSVAFFEMGSSGDSISLDSDLSNYIMDFIVRLRNNPDYSIELKFHSDSSNSSAYFDLIENVTKIFTFNNISPDRIIIRNFLDRFPIDNINLIPLFSQSELNNRLEFNLFDRNNFNSEYFYPDYYYSNSSYINISYLKNSENLMNRDVGASEFISEKDPNGTKNPIFSIIVGSFSSLIQAIDQQGMLSNRFPTLEFKIVAPTFFSTRYRISVYESSVLKEIKDNINFFEEKNIIQGIWILEY